VLTLPGDETRDTADDGNLVPSVRRGNERVDVDTRPDEDDVPAREPPDPVRRETADGEAHIGISKRPGNGLSGTGCRCRESHLGTVAEYPVRHAEPISETRAKERKRVGSSEEDDIGRESRRTFLDPCSDLLRRPHEGGRVTAHPIVGLRSRVGRRDDVVVVGVGSDHVPEVLLDASRLRRVVVRDQQQSHDQIPA